MKPVYWMEHSLFLQQFSYGRGEKDIKQVLTEIISALLMVQPRLTSPNIILGIK
jgi:hypothetical protein